MRSFEIDIIFVKYFFKSDLYLGHILRCFDHISLIYQIEPLLYFHQTEVWTPPSYAKMFGSDERLIQFWLSRYPML